MFSPNLTELRPSFVKFSGDSVRFQQNSDIIRKSYEFLPNFTEPPPNCTQFSQIRTECSPNLLHFEISTSVYSRVDTVCHSATNITI